MYTITVPIRNVTVNKLTRPRYLKLLQDAKVDRLLLTRSDFCANEAEERQMIEEMRDNIQYFRNHGIDTQMWVGNTTGHGGVLVGMKAQTVGAELTPIISIRGEAVPETRCPMDPSVRDMLAHHFTLLAQTGAKTILLDDDFRMSHGKDHCCACDYHMKRICELCGEEITREELEQKVFHEKANKYRAAWVTAQKEALLLLAHTLRDAVDSVDPTIRLALCSSHGLWGVDGADAIELSKILAGNNQPLIRLLDAPYIAIHSNKPFPAVLERARMFAALAKDCGAELMAEGDVYPRPRCETPASYLEIFDGVMRADGIYDGILKYMADYNSTPEYETGYFRLHNENLPMQQELTEMFAGKTACGVRVPVYAHDFDEADLELGSDSHYYPYPLAGAMFAGLSIPTTYEEGGICNAVFGESGRHIPEEELSLGAILDGTAAVILQERGIDVGLNAHKGMVAGEATALLTADHSENAPASKGTLRYLKNPTLKEGAEPVLLAKVDGEEQLIAYRYENEKGQRFLVYLFEALSIPFRSGLFKGYLQQQTVIEHTQWIARSSLPVTCTGNPDLYIMCREKDGKRAVALFNCYADKVLHPVIHLDRPYRSVRFLNTSGALDQDTVTLDTPIHAFEFVAFELEE